MGSSLTTSSPAGAWRRTAFVTPASSSSTLTRARSSPRPCGSQLNRQPEASGAGTSSACQVSSGRPSHSATTSPSSSTSWYGGSPTLVGSDKPPPSPQAYSVG